LLSRRSTYQCRSELVSNGSAGQSDADCGPSRVGKDSTVVFTRGVAKEDWNTVGAWRTYANLRWEFNARAADYDFFVGPSATLGFQTDPGIDSPDFFGIILGGLSLTQVEIRPEYYEERMHVQVLYGRSANYAEEVISRLDTTTVRHQITVPYTPRWFISTTFQPATGFFLRGTAEFGHGVPDIARIGVVTSLGITDLLNSVIGKKKRASTTD
jgi:hypothetical protein